MADVAELIKALQNSKLRILPLEEHVFVKALNEVESKILKALEGDKEVRSPYELN